MSPMTSSGDETGKKRGWLEISKVNECNGDVSPTRASGTDARPEWTIELAGAADRVRGLKVVILLGHFFGGAEQDILHPSVGDLIPCAERTVRGRDDSGFRRIFLGQGGGCRKKADQKCSQKCSHWFSSSILSGFVPSSLQGASVNQLVVDVTRRFN